MERHEEVIVVASLNNSAFDHGYVIPTDPLAIPDARMEGDLQQRRGGLRRQ